MSNKVAQDSDIKDRKGTQPKKYHSGLSKSTKAKRDAHFKKGAKMDDDNPAAYKPAPGDASSKTKESKYTKKYKKMYGEEMSTEEIFEDVSAALKKKSEKSGVSVGVLRKVYNRGVAAWRTGHRPGTTPAQWGMARVNSYITKGKTYHTADKDLRESPEDKESASPDEKSMALKQAEFIMYVGKEIGEHLKANREFPEWMQNKLSALHQKAKDMHSTLGAHGMDEEVELDEGVGKYTVKILKKTPQFKIYDIMKGGEKVGVIKHHPDSGSITGKLHGKDLPDLGGYKYTGSGPLGKLHAFLKSKTGQKFNEEVELGEATFRVDVEGLPTFYMNAPSQAKVKLALRKLLRKASSIDDVERVTPTKVRADYRDRVKNPTPDSDEGDTE